MDLVYFTLENIPISLEIMETRPSVRSLWDGQSSSSSLVIIWTSLVTIQNSASERFTGRKGGLAAMIQSTIH